MQREKFASQADPALLALIRTIAAEQGRQLQAVIEDALRSYAEQMRSTKARPHVLAAYKQSVKQFDSLYRKLAQ